MSHLWFLISHVAILLATCQHCTRLRRLQSWTRGAIYANRITWRRVRETIVAVEKQWVLHTLSVSAPLIMHHAMQYAVLYWNLCPVRPYLIFTHYLTNEKIFGKTLVNIKYAFWFSLHLLSETILILGRIQGNIITSLLRFSHQVPVIPVRL